MKRKLFIACTALIVSATAVVGVKAYNYYSMPALMRANLDALSQGEIIGSLPCFDKYDSPSWWVDDWYERVCQDPEGKNV